MELLAATTIPADLARALVEDASTLWLMSAPAASLAADLALCHPALGQREVRAVANPLEGGAHRLTVATHDRRGLLADTAAVLAAEGLSISAASAATWSRQDIALHAVIVAPGRVSPLWPDLGTRLRALSADTVPRVEFKPRGTAVVMTSDPTADHCLVTVTAPDQVGLLWATCRWLADAGANIQAAHVGGHDGMAEDHFIVAGEVDAEALAAHLSAAPG
jgi:[protein-PII] uridylyltransferase